MTDTVSKTHEVEKALRLYQQRKEILKLSSDKALDRILSSDTPADLVQSFPEQDFYFLIHDIGLEDCLPLLSLASDPQWEYIVDVEGWQKDHIDMRSLSKWFNRLLQASPQRFIQWFLKDKTEFVELYLLHNLHIIVREHDQDPSDFGEGYVTFDNVYYIKIPDAGAGYDSDKESGEQREAFLRRFIERLSAFDHTTFQNVLMEIQAILPTESEEEAYRMKTVRLAEKGFLSFEEAIGVYQAVAPGDVGKLGTKALSSAPGDELDAMALYPAGLIKRDNLFSTAIACIDSEDVLMQVQSEFAGLCNQIISADQNPIRYREQLSGIVKKACGYLSIGLHRLIGDESLSDRNRMASLIRTYPLIQIFRVGYGAALELKWKAQRWRKRCWFLKQGRSLGFWEEQWMGVLGGLFLKRPLYFDNYRTGGLYREFSSLDDIITTDATLSDIIALDDLFSEIPALNQPISEGFVTYKRLLLTLWARSEENLSEEFIPIPLTIFKRFYRKMFPKREGSDLSHGRRASIRMKESLLRWISVNSGLPPEDIGRRVGRVLEHLFDEIEAEYGHVSEEDLDPRYISFFYIGQ